MVLSQNWDAFGVWFSTLQSWADCFLFHCSDLCCPYCERAKRLVCLFMVLCELDMLNKMLQHIISLLLDATLTVVVVPRPWEVSDKTHLWHLICETELNSCPHVSAVASFPVCFHLCLCVCAHSERTRILRRLGAVLYYSSVVMSERSWQHLWTYWSYPLVSCLTSGGGGEKEVGSTQTHTSSLEPRERAQPPVSLPLLVSHLALRH